MGGVQNGVKKLTPLTQKKIDLQKTFCFWHSRSILIVKTEGKWGFGWGPGREAPPGSVFLHAPGLGGGRAESFRFLFLRIKVLRFKGLKDWRIQKMNHTRQTEKSKNRKTDWLNELNAWRIENSLKKSYWLYRGISLAVCPRGRRIFHF